MTEAFDMAVRLRAIAAAQGKEPFDLLIAGGRVLDVATLELREADVGIVGAMIASVHPRGALSAARETHDVHDRIVAPGFIDAHVHVESSHMLPHHYAAVVVAQGTTTIFWDPHELANVLGIAGVRYAIEAASGLPLRFIVQASSCSRRRPVLKSPAPTSRPPRSASSCHGRRSRPCRGDGYARINRRASAHGRDPERSASIERSSRATRAASAERHCKPIWQRASADHEITRAPMHWKAARRPHRRNSRLTRLPASRCRRRHQHAAGRSDQFDDLHRRRFRRSGRARGVVDVLRRLDPLRPRPDAGGSAAPHQ